MTDFENLQRKIRSPRAPKVVRAKIWAVTKTLTKLKITGDCGFGALLDLLDLPSRTPHSRRSYALPGESQRPVRGNVLR